MGKFRPVLKSAFAAAGIVCVILFPKTALLGVSDGIDLCIKSVIPALFPFIFLSGLLSASLSSFSFRWFRPLGRLLGIPNGAESIFLLGCISGYPAGAQMIHTQYESGTLTKEDAKRMLGFCSNAGPSFIFGIAGSFFDSPIAPWILWGIQIVSAVIVAVIFKEDKPMPVIYSKKHALTASSVLRQTIHALCVVCGWVVLFRTAIVYLERWGLNLLPEWASIVAAGFLELTNGCVQLGNIQSELSKFVIASVMLSFGGCCVAMQTVSITQELGPGLYFPGKVLQCVCSGILSFGACSILISGKIVAGITAFLILFLMTHMIIKIKKLKIIVEKPGHLQYNKVKS